MKRHIPDPAFEAFCKMNNRERTAKYGRPVVEREYRNGGYIDFLAWQVSSSRRFRHRLHEKPQND